MVLDGLRPPGVADPERALYKDWLNLNVLDPRSGAIGLVNIALHGAPEDPRARAVATALLHLPGEGWVGNIEVSSLGDADVSELHIGLATVGLALDVRAQAVIASIRMPEHGLTLDLRATVAARAMAIPLRVPLGDGWISWATVPRLTVRGHATVAGRPLDLGGAGAYHDHNWGRWRWGDDLGWEWGCFQATDGEAAIVYSRATDRAHARGGRPFVTLHAFGRRRTFTGASVSIDYGGQLRCPPRRVPGALAALRSDRARPRLPARVTLVAGDGRDHFVLQFEPRAAAQAIVAEVSSRGYGFIHELPGSFSLTGVVAGRSLTLSGLGMYEHVD